MKIQLLFYPALLAVLASTPLLASGEALAARPQPIDSYLITDRGEEIRLARSAAPPTVAEQAGVWVLSPDGYVEAEPSGNGFVCLVGRGWSAPVRFVNGSPNSEFWSSAVRAPMCLNPEAVRTILPVLTWRTERAIARKSLGEIEAETRDRFERGEFVAPSGVAMSYMLSPDQHLGERVGHYLPHVMLYAPGARDHEWGRSGLLSGWPFIGESEGQPHALVIIPVGTWSDGSPVEHGGASGR